MKCLHTEAVTGQGEVEKGPTRQGVVPSRVYRTGLVSVRGREESVSPESTLGRDYRVVCAPVQSLRLGLAPKQHREDGNKKEIKQVGE